MEFNETCFLGTQEKQIVLKRIVSFISSNTE